MTTGAQDPNIPVHPSRIVTGTYWGESKPLRNLPAMTKKELRDMERKAKKRVLNEGLEHRSYPYADVAYPRGEDPVWQKSMGQNRLSRNPIVNFEGQTSPYYPPDDNGMAGPNHYMQTINTVYAIYDKSGILVAGPTNLNLLFGSVPGANRNDGDPIILYDEQADRWLVTEFSIPAAGQNYLLMAVSTTNDPTGTWHQYSFPVDYMPDYPKYGVWRDGYYAGVNNNSGNDIFVFQRSQMLIGGPALMVAFNNPYRPASVDGFMCVPPLDNDGVLAPTGSPGLFIAFNDDAFGGGTDQLWIYELSVDWTNTPASTFNRVQQIDVEPFNCNFGPNWNNITQKGTNQKLDGIPQVIMNVPQYRNFTGYQTIVCCHTVNVDGNGHAGVRWYELRKTGTDWYVRQHSTYAPDIHSRWMGSIMLNSFNSLALGYSISSTSEYPGIRYCGQSPLEYQAESGIMDIEEDTIHVGFNSQTGLNRCGDYSVMAVDPTDNKTFWYTNQYVWSGGSRRTKIASFKFITGPEATTLPATDITGISATLNGIVNPLGTETTYHFEYGLFPFSLTDSTPPSSAGSGDTAVHVSAAITDLMANTKYYFRVVATNALATVYGTKLNFTTTNEPMLSVIPPNRDVGISPGITEFYVTSNVAWNVSSDTTLCTVTPSGAGNDTIFASYEENTSVETRIANITVSGTGVSSQIVTVTQEGVTPILIVNPPNQNVGAGIDSTTFTVTSNTTWTVLSDVTWCTVTPAGSGNGIIWAKVTENPAITERIATITVIAQGGPFQIVTVTQAGQTPFITINPPYQNVSASAGTTSFDVLSNTTWNVLSDATWCTVTPSGSGNGTIVANYQENTSSLARSANIEVTATGLPAQTVVVNQAKSVISVEDHMNDPVKIYPNPTKGLFRIVPEKKDQQAFQVIVEDQNGKCLLRKLCSGEKEYQIDLSQAGPGVYHIILKSDQWLVKTRLIVIK